MAFDGETMPRSTNNTREEALISALTKYQAALRGFCQAALGNGEEAKEALQRTNIVLWKKCENWDPDSDFLRWATAVARFEVKGVIRDRKREGKRLLFDSDVAELLLDEAADVVVPMPERLSALDVCLEKVSTKNRAVLTAFYAHGKTIPEISESEDRGQSAIKILLMRLRRSLGKCIEAQMAKGGAT